MKKILVQFLLFAVIFPSSVFAGRPLSTGGAGVVDTGHFELESGVEYLNKSDNECNRYLSVKYGLRERMDVGISIPFMYTAVAGDNNNGRGVGDVELSTQYQFLKEDEGFADAALGLTIKTGTGDEDRGLGTGGVDYSLKALLTKSIGNYITHWNLGYTYSGTGDTGHDDVVSYAAAIEIPCADRFILMGELTGETNLEDGFNDNPCAALIGFSYALSKIWSVDIGTGVGISDASPEYKITLGTTLAF